MECETRTKRWGNSIGVVLPKEVVEKEKIKPNDNVRLLVTKMKRQNNLKYLFGIGKGKIKQSAQEIKDELRETLYDD